MVVAVVCMMPDIPMSELERRFLVLFFFDCVYARGVFPFSFSWQIFRGYDHKESDI